MDGDARGAALSVKEVTGKPIKFVGMGSAWTNSRPSDRRTILAGDIVGLTKDLFAVDEKKAEEDVCSPETSTCTISRSRFARFRKLVP